jgi:hypothetical protein
MDVGETIVATLEFISQSFVVNAQEVKDGGVEVVDADGILDDVV